jgi:hypothetical protein
MLTEQLLHPLRGAHDTPRALARRTAGDSDFADACVRYRDLLAKQSTFSSMTIEELLEANVLPAETSAAVRERYLPC